MKTTRYKIQYLLVCCSFGLLSIFVRRIALPTLSLVFARAAIAAVFLMLFMLVRRIKPSARELRENAVYLVLSGLCIGIGHCSLFLSYQYTSVAVATLFYYLAPIFLMILAAIVLKEKITRRSVVAILMALAGMVLVSGALRGGLPRGRELTGILIATFGALSYAGYMLLAKLYKPMNTYVQTCAQLCVTSVLMLIVSAATGQLSALAGLDPVSVAYLLVLAIVFTGISYVLYIQSLEHIPSASAAILAYADPAVAVFVSAVFFKEPLDIFSILGAVLIIGASVYRELGEKKSREP